MNRHFEDARYYLGRAAETAKDGVKTEVEEVRTKFRELTGREDEAPEPSRLEKLQDDLTEIEARAEGEARRAVTSARDRIAKYRREE